MFDVIIPIRSGSKGIKHKNIKYFKNDILVNYKLKKLLNIKDINKIFILTNSNSYKNKIINHSKINLEYIRPQKYSKDNSKIYDLISDFFNWASKKNIKMEKIIILQVTSPLLEKKEIIETIKFIKKNSNIQSLFHVSEMMEHPYECIDGVKNKWKHILKNNSINRQNFKKFYFITGSLWYFTKNFFLKNRKFYNSKSYAYEVDKINFVDIDSKFDFELAKKLVGFKHRN